MEAVRRAVVDAAAVVLHGLRLVLAHWPVLAAVYLLGAAGRNGFLWLAVWLSRDHSTLANLVLPLAPLSTLVAFIVMLLVVSRSLGSLSVDTSRPGDDARAAGWLGVLASTLVPFLTVYAAQGYLKQDVRAFVNEATYDELFGNADTFYGVAHDADRTAIATGWTLVAIIVIALVVRFGFDHYSLPARSRPAAFAAAYVEVLWIVTLGVIFSGWLDRGWAWIRDRVFVEWVQERWASLIDVLGPVGQPIAAVVGWIDAFVDDADDVLLVPIAWLTVAAVAFGTSIAVPTRQRRSRRRASSRWSAATDRTPGVIKRWAGEATSGFRGRFTGLRDGFRLLALGGLVPMAMFCLVFVIARQGGALVREGWRLVLGPQERDTALAFAPWLEVSAGVVEYVLLAGLLAAAIDRILATQARLAAEREVQDVSTGSST